MAFLAELGALTDELVTTITSTSSTTQPERFRAYHDSALRSIRNKSYLQTNQFVIKDQLDGLVERFSIVGRDALSEALRQRLLSLSKQSTRFTPEVLHFLLELSDQPVKKTKSDVLERLRPPDEDQTARLKWEDIAREDGWAQDRGLWENVDFEDISEDEVYPDSQSPTSDSDQASVSSGIVPNQRTAEDLVLPDSENELQLQEIHNSQRWRKDAQPKDPSGRLMKLPISELQIIREVLFLLNGLQTNLFGPDCTPVPKYQLSNVMWDTYRALVNSFAEYGRILLPLRTFCLTKHDVHLVQCFQDSVCHCLQVFDKQIALIQQHYIDVKADTIVSLIALEEELRPHLAPMAALSNVVRQLQEERFAHAFRFLELLYDATCLAQLSGDEPTYAYLGEIFLSCFQVYIRPIRQWMEAGELTPGDKTFFVAESSSSVPLNQIWSAKFQLRKSQQDQLHAPRFLQPAVRKIFNTGKSIVVLKQLGRFQCPRDYLDTALPEPKLDFQAVCGSTDFSFAPFSELFDGAFDRWVQSKYLSTSSNLQAILFDHCGLWTSLDALQLVYFMADGSLAETFTSSVFTSLDALNTTWSDRFSLTELAQEAWSSCPSLEGYRLSASVEPRHIFRGDPDMARRSVRNTLPGIRLFYKLAWPIQLVLTKETIMSYQSIFTLLLQLSRATGILTVSSALLKSQHNAIDTDELAAYYGLRSRLLWFMNTLKSYLTTLVLAPVIAKMRADLQKAEDVDDMIDIHAGFAKRIIEEACLGPKLTPIRECLLDMFDLAIRLEDARRVEVEQQQQQREGEETAQFPRQFVIGTPKRSVAASTTTELTVPQSVLRGLYVSPQEKEREEDNNTIMLFEDEEGDNTYDSINASSIFEHPHQTQRKQQKQQQQQTYSEALVGIKADFDRHLRFIAGGLRGVARASTDAAAAKWDILAEMFEMGIKDR